MRSAHCLAVSSVCIASILVPGPQARAGESAWSVRVWQSDGLPDRYVNGLAQSEDGFLWLATSDHLARFDGARFEAFPVRPLVPRGIRTLLQGRAGLWLAMNRGPVVLLRAGVKPRVVNGLPDLSADTAVEGDDGAVWIAYHSGTVSRIKDGHVTSFDRSAGLVEDASCWLTKDGRGRLWYAQAGQLGVFSAGRFRPLLQLPNAVTRLTSARAGGIWIGSGYRLFRYDAGGPLVDMGSLPAANQGARLTVLLEGHDGALWIGTRHDGLFRRSASGVESVPSSHPAIRCLMEDREGDLWVGTGGGGLNRVQPRVVEVEGASTGFSSQAVQSVIQDAKGDLWATTRNGLLVRRTKDVWQEARLGRGRERGATCVAADGSGAIWIGTRGQQLHRWWKGRLTTWGPAQGLDAHTICTLLVSRSGDVWIAGESPSGRANLLRASVQKLHAGRLEGLALPAGTRRTQAIVEDARGAVWIGGAGGRLLRSANGAPNEEPGTSRAVNKQIRSLHATSDGSVWIGYDDGGGLGRWKDGRFARVGLEQGLPALAVAQIVSDATGSLWLGTESGLFKVDRRELDAVMDGRSSHLRSINVGAGEASFTVSAGECGWTGGLLTREGAIWMPMGTALLIAHPDRLPDDARPPRVLVTRVAVDGQVQASYGGFLPWPIEGRPAGDLRHTAALAMQAGDRRLEIEFTAPTFRDPDNVRFRYRLDNFDEAWVDAGSSRIARYPRLAPGSYRFRVSSCTREGACDERGAAGLDISVAPLFWQTWWFRLGSLGTFTAVLVAAVRYASFRRLRRSLVVLAQQATLDRERTRIARDIHDDVGNRLNRITLLSELALREAAAPVQMAAHVRDISSAVREVISALDEVVWAVSPRHDTLPHLVSRLGQFAVEYLRTAGIRCELELPPHPPDWPLSAEVRHNVFCAVKEALTNSVRHAHPCEVRLRVELAADSLAVVIQDDGRGFEAPPSDPGADGLRNMRQRMAEIGGELQVTSAPGAGTRVRLALRRPPAAAPSQSDV